MGRKIALLLGVLTLVTGLGPLAKAEPGVAVATNRIVAGLYAPLQWYSAAHLNEVNNVASKKVSIGGVWIDVDEPPENIKYLLEQIWSAGATPFVNIHVPGTAAEVAAGRFDFEIGLVGHSVSDWLATGGERSVMLAPMPEMNGDWIPYGIDPINFREAYRRFVSIANEKGSPNWKVRWVFAPNGWSTPPHRMIDYYPGHDFVDLVGMSAYNWGTNVPGGSWTTVEQTMGAALDQAREFALDKPFLISQTATSPFGGDKDAWLRDMFSFLANDPNAVGFIYFNIAKERDWTIWRGGFVSPGWNDGMGMDSTVYQWPITDWFQPGPLVVDTYPPPFVGTFWDDERSTLVTEIEWLAASGITVGCGDHRFCPRDPVTRGEMASFLARALTLAIPGTDYFTDDQGSVHEGPANALRESEISFGCSESKFCSNAPTTREQMASFIFRALDLPPATSDYFSDDAGSVHENDINALRQSGITTGCTSVQYCPTRSITREQMAAFLYRALNG